MSKKRGAKTRKSTTHFPFRTNMPMIQIHIVHLVGTLVITGGLLGCVLWLHIRDLRDQISTLTSELAAHQHAASQLQSDCDQYRFEIEWLTITAEAPLWATQIFDFFRRWSASPATFQSWMIYPTGESEGSHLTLPVETLQQTFPRHSLHAQFQRENHPQIFAELPLDLHTLHVFHCKESHRNEKSAASSLLVLSGLPNCLKDKRSIVRLEELMQRLRCEPRQAPEPVLNFDQDVASLIAKEMLEIRSLLDVDFQTPLEMMQGFLKKLAELSGYHWASLFVREESTNTFTGTRKLTHFASGGTLRDAADLQRWSCGESAFVELFAQGLTDPLLITTETILHLDEQIPFRCGLLIPVRDAEQSLGVLMLTHPESTIPDSEDAQLIEWASRFIMKSLQRELLRAAVSDEARRDALTQLANRRTFDTELARAIEQSENSLEPCSLIMLDVDHFKAVNDDFGHPAGDLVLVKVAESLQSLAQNLRVSDHALAARYGGEEFALILPNVGFEGAVRIAEQLRKRIEELEFSLPDGLLTITASLGVATAGQDGRSPLELIESADQGLYIAKESGRNRVRSIRTTELVSTNSRS